VLQKIKIAEGRPIDGHAPGLSGRDLNAYVAAGIGSDHECTTADEAREKLRLGMHIMIREGTTARDLENLLPVVTAHNAANCMFVTDDRHLPDLMHEGHVAFAVRKAVALGLDPVLAIQMATINPARYFGLRGLGGIGAGMQADMIVLDDLRAMNAEMVFRQGKLVAQEGTFIPPAQQPREVPVRSSMNINWQNVGHFEVPAREGYLRVIGVVPDQLVTDSLLVEPSIHDGQAVADIERDVLKMAVLERHLASGNVGIGFVHGLGLQRGALASSVAHDSHNVIVVGTNDGDMRAAAEAIERMRAGWSRWSMARSWPAYPYRSPG